MPDWRYAVERRLAGLRLAPARETEIVDELFGLATGWAIARMMQSLLFQTSALDPLTYLTGIGLLVLCGLVASYVPARRAVAIDPVVVLKRN